MERTLANPPRATTGALRDDPLAHFDRLASGTSERIHVGCSGWEHRRWSGLFYPLGTAPEERLERYSRIFDTVEVDSSFYRLPSADAVERWLESTPPGFEFSFRASQYLTHVTRLADIEQGGALFYERIEPIDEAGKLGPILWQLPERFTRDEDRLALALELLPPGRHCFEFQHPSWFHPDVYEMLIEAEVGLAVGDHPDRQFQEHVRTAPWAMVRLDCGSRGRDGGYSRLELERWRRRIASWAQTGSVYTYFNNDSAEQTLAAAVWMLHRLGR